MIQILLGERGRGVNPGETRDIVWTVDAACGPRDEDPVCITSLYYSNVDLVKDVNSGLVGITKICRTGNVTRLIVVIIAILFGGTEVAWNILFLSRD